MKYIVACLPTTVIEINELIFGTNQKKKSQAFISMKQKKYYIIFLEVFPFFLFIFLVNSKEFVKKCIMPHSQYTQKSYITLINDQINNFVLANKHKFFEFQLKEHQTRQHKRQYFRNIFLNRFKIHCFGARKMFPQHQLYYKSLFHRVFIKSLSCIIIINQHMTSNNSYSLHKRRYAQISIKKRKALVQLVLFQGKSLSQAGRKLHINPSTVRLIVKKYKQTGSFFNKKLRNAPKEVTKFYIEEQSQQNLIKIEEKQQVLLKQQYKSIPKDRITQVKAQEGHENSLRPQYPFLCYGYIY